VYIFNDVIVDRKLTHIIYHAWYRWCNENEGKDQPNEW